VLAYRRAEIELDDQEAEVECCHGDHDNDDCYTMRFLDRNAVEGE